MYYIHKGHRGSINCITDQSGTLVEEMSFDAWGRRRNPTDWTYNGVPGTFLFARGFTGHEHIDEFDLINMNGRIYDPVICHFLSPDNFIQAPEYTVNYSRYAYAFNNPLLHTDPDGEFIHLIAAAMLGGFFNMCMMDMAGKIEMSNPGEAIGAFAVGAAAGAVGGIAGQAVAGAVGTVGFAGGALTGGAAGFSGGFVLGAGNAWMGGANFGDGLVSGLQSGVIGGLTSGIIGGIGGGIGAKLDPKYKRSFWNGEIRGIKASYRNAVRNYNNIGELLLANLNDESIHGGYIERPYEYSKRYIRWTPEDGLIPTGSFNVAGNIKIDNFYGTSYCTTYIHAASGQSLINDIKYYGYVDILEGNTRISSYRLLNRGHNFIPETRTLVGGVKFPLPTTLNKEVYLRIRVGYSTINYPGGNWAVRNGIYRIRLQRFWQGFVY